MNSTIQKIFTIGIVGLLIYFLIWPFVNSFISGNFYIKTTNEGQTTMSFETEVRSNRLITATITNYNNVATEKQGNGVEGPFSYTVDESTYEKIVKIIRSYAGFHIFARNHAGYGFYYDGANSGSTLYSTEEKNRLFEMAEILTYLARGDEKTDTKKSSKTYKEKGIERLEALYKKLEL